MLKKLLVAGLLISCFSAGSVLAYTVQKGDTISGLAKQFEISQKEIVRTNGIKNPNFIYVGQELELGIGVPEVLGASRNYVEIPDSTLYSGAIVGDTSITLDQLVDIYGNSLVMADFGDKGYGRINPEGNNISESFSFSGITANADGTKTLTGIKTVLAKSPYTESSGIIRSHGIGSTVRITNTAGFYNDFANKNNFETIAKVWLFSALPESNGVLLATTSNQFVTKQYADNLTVQGAPTSTESIAGRVKLGTQTNMASSTYDASDPTVVYTRYTTSTPGTPGKYVPVTENDGKLNQTFIDLTDNFSWVGANSFSVTSTFNGPVKVSSTFQSTQPLTVFVTTTSSTLPRVAVDQISPNTAATTTFTGNFQVNGNFSHLGADVGNGIKWEYMSTSDCDAPCDIPAGAKAAVVNMNITSGGETSGATSQVFAIGLTDSRINATVLQGASSVSCYQALSWGATQLSATETGTCTALDTDVYWFK